MEVRCETGTDSQKDRTAKGMKVLWYVVHRKHPGEIELCGIFRDIAHFEFVRAVEAARGWTVTRYDVLS